MGEPSGRRMFSILLCFFLSKEICFILFHYKRCKILLLLISVAFKKVNGKMTLVKNLSKFFFFKAKFNMKEVKHRKAFFFFKAEVIHLNSRCPPQPGRCITQQ